MTRAVHLRPEHGMRARFNLAPGRICFRVSVTSVISLLAWSPLVRGQSSPAVPSAVTANVVPAVAPAVPRRRPLTLLP